MIFETFNRFDRPLIYTPGDNEWTDCRRTVYGAYALVGRLKVIREVFFSTDKSMGANPMKLVRPGEISNYPLYVENSRWLHNRVLFFTLNVPGSSNNYEYEDADALRESHDRSKANVAWLRDSFRIARKHGMKAVVVALHAEMFNNKKAQDGMHGPHGMIVRELAVAGKRFGSPVLLIHGDAHEFTVDRPFIVANGVGTKLKNGNITRLAVFGSPEIRAVKVRIDPATPWVFEFAPLYNE